MTTLLWFRRDLRLEDNPALCAAATDGATIPVYVHSDDGEDAWPPGAASRWWLHRSLESLHSELRRTGSRLIVRSASDAGRELVALARECGAQRIVWNRCYEPAAAARDRRVAAALRAAGLAIESHNASLLHEPGTITNKAGGPFQVFTPFWRHCLTLPDPPPPLPPPRALPAPSRWPRSQALDALALRPAIAWDAGLRTAWRPGSREASMRLRAFAREAFALYPARRDRPDQPGTSRLSPHLHFGEIGPRQIWHAAREVATAHGTPWRDAQFLAELGWREFAHHLLHHFPRTPAEPFRPAFARFPWLRDPRGLEAWRRGRTGYPIVDAGMRELWRTGWMHNRVRMIVASFLVKDLLLPWSEGAAWFWDTLVDADLAANTLNWQWAAGCGADAAPYFRIFNPTAQGKKCDPEGRYVRRHLPELARLPAAWIHEPWNAPPATLRAARIDLGADYPRPIVAHAAARRRALAALASIARLRA